MMDDVTALVLAGGKSSRMGRDKTLLALGGQTMLARACAFGRSLGCPVLVAAGSEAHFDALPGGARAVYDAAPGLGPLSGLCAGLSAMETEFALVFAADMPYLSEAAAQLLLGAIGDADVCLFQSDGHPEPLFALYRKRCLAAAAAALGAGELRLRALLRTLRTVTLDAPDGALFVNLNTPEEFESVRRQVERHE